MLRWICIILCCSVRAELVYYVYASTPSANQSFPSGQSVAFAGAEIKMTCYYEPYPCGNLSWYRWDKEAEKYNIKTDGCEMSFKAVVKDSGEYKCFTGPITGGRNAVVSLTVVERLSPLQVVATPADAIIVEGHRVTLHCSTSSLPSSVTWTWHRMEQLGGWQDVCTERDLTLTEAGESGQYRCHALSQVGIQQEDQSPNHTVVIISLPTTARENVGVAAFVLCLLAWILFSAILLWFGWQKANERASSDALASTNAPAKSLAGPPKAPKGSIPQSEGDGEVYMNYTNTNQDYGVLNPTYMAGEDVYSNLS